MILSLLLILSTSECDALVEKIQSVQTIQGAMLAMKLAYSNVTPQELDHVTMVILKRMFGEKKNLTTTIKEQQAFLNFLRSLGAKKEMR